MIKYILTILILVICFSSCNQLDVKDDNYVILISFDGFRYDYADSVNTPALHQIEREGVRATGLKPIFPSKTFPNHYAIATGLYAENHGIIANTFFDPEIDSWYRIGDTLSVRNPQWYDGEPIWVTAEKNDITTASYFWVGSEAPIKNTSPTYFYYYDHSRPHQALIKQTFDWLNMPQSQRPRLILLYFHDTDDMGHYGGPMSEANKKAIQSLDSVITELRAGIKKLEMEDQINLILVSDHGMREVSKDRLINIEDWVNPREMTIVGNGPLMNVHVKEKEKIPGLYDILKKNETHYSIYKRDEIPAKWHYRKSSRIGDFILVAEPGWSLITNRNLKRIAKYGMAGNHGWDNDDPQMRGIFYAIGPDFKKGLRTKVIRNIDVYPLVADILGIKEIPKIDGALDSIRIVLNIN